MAKSKYYPKGLHIEEVNERNSLGKNNIKTQANFKTNWEIISSNVFTFFNMILFLLAILLFSIQSYRNMWFMVIALINTTIGVVQEFRARSIIKKLSLITEHHITVVREELFFDIDIEDIVLDDIVLYKTGKQIVPGNLDKANKLNVDAPTQNIPIILPTIISFRAGIFFFTARKTLTKTKAVQEHIMR